MKFELICDNCGGKTFSIRCCSRKLGGWDDDGERESSTERLFCEKCNCCISIIYEQKMDKEKRLEIEYSELGNWLIGKNRKKQKEQVKPKRRKTTSRRITR